MIDFDTAVGRIVGLARPLDREPVSLASALGRVLAEPVTGCSDAPATPVSTMDGYAVRDADLTTIPASLPVVDTVFPGRAGPSPLPPGNCARVFTGAAVPAGADRVVMQEQVRRDGDRAVFEAVPGGPRFIRAAGSDFRAGDVLLESGVRLNPRSIVAAAAADLAQLQVIRRPKVMVLSTGDELAEPGAAAGTPGAIPDSVSFGVMAMAAIWGAEVVGRRRLADAPGDLRAAADEALGLADVIVVTGGASVGEKDFARAMFDAVDLELVFSKVAIKPGKPVWAGRARGRIVLGLPGNPTSAMVTARLLLAPLLAGLGGLEPMDALAWRTTPLAEPLEATGDRETFYRGRRHGPAVAAIANQDSGSQKALAEAEVLIRRRAGQAGAGAGEAVEVLDL